MVKQMNKHRKAQFRRKIPILSIPLSNDQDYSKIGDIPGFKNVIMNELVIAIKDGLYKNKKSITLFEISNSKTYVNIDKENWASPLTEAMDYFSQIENYEKCTECRDLIKQL